MKDRALLRILFFSSLVVAAIAGFFFLFTEYRTLFSRASESSLTMKIKLQGESYPLASISATVAFYTAAGKAKEYTNVPFTYQGDKTFKGTVVFDSTFNHEALYAVFIKPNRYFGRIFCSYIVDGKACTSPQFLFRESMYMEDLTKKPFYGGDIDPANGKVDALDISKIMKNLGKAEDPSTDINNDGITNSMDYMIALYSLGQNMTDDVVALVNPALTPTATPSATLTPGATPSVAPTLTPTVAPAATATPVPTATLTPTPTVAPTTAPTATTAPTPTTAQTAGTCHVIPGSLAKSICGETEQDVPATTAFSACEGSSSTNPLCTGSKSKGRCTCPAGKVCSCQLIDEATQTINCTNGGKFEIVEC